MCSLKPWEQVVTSVFGRSIPKNLVGVLCGKLFLVHLGIKPSYLWDLPVKIDKTKIITMISELKSKNVTEDNVSTLFFSEEYFVINKKALENVFSHLQKCIFVDCSLNLTHPQILLNATSINHMISECMRRIREKQSCDLISIETDVDWYPPTLFGFLLGYPVIYWSSTCDNNLSQQALDLFKINYSQHDLEIDDVYSFSAPSNISAISNVRSWHRRIEQESNTCLSLSVSSVCFSSVTL